MAVRRVAARGAPSRTIKVEEKILSIDLRTDRSIEGHMRKKRLMRNLIRKMDAAANA